VSHRAAAYRDELTRGDNAHAARLENVRNDLLIAIKWARENLPDWPITAKDVAAQELSNEMTERIPTMTAHGSEAVGIR
jgi:hypothetical protein